VEFGGIRLGSRVLIQRVVLLVLALVVASLGFGQPANAEGGSAEPDMKAQLLDVWNRDLFTGDWQGMRTQLHDHGIDVGLRLSQYGQGVASGGVNKNGEYGGTMDYRVNADLKKLFGLWEGLTVHSGDRERFDRSGSASKRRQHQARTKLSESYALEFVG
jgi:hypothetical protein